MSDGEPGPQLPPGIARLALPTPFAVGDVNTYLIDDDPLTLVDVGPNTGTTLDALEQALAQHGRRVEDLERIVLTHQHMDHIGLAQILARRSGAEVCALDALAPWLADFDTRMEADDRYAEDLMHRHGIPRDVSLALRAVASIARSFGAAVTVGHELHHGGTLDFAGRSLRVLHRPGHSPSDTVFHDEATGVALGGDHLIGHISSNPLITRPLEQPSDPDAPRVQTLVTYLASLQATSELDLRVVLPGHGDPVSNHRALIAERAVMHERRAEKLYRQIALRPHTAHELAQELWGKVALTQAFLTLSEVLGHTDLLVNAGRVVEVLGEDGVARFEATP